MTDEWSARPANIEVTEVPLRKDEIVPVGGPDRDDRRGSTRRRRVVALVGGGALVATAVIAIAGDDDTDTTPASIAPDGDELASSITTPATLRPLETLPRPDDPEPTGRPLDDEPQATTSQDRTVFDSVQVPTYPEIQDVNQSELAEFDIAPAVQLLATDIPRQSDTHVELGNAGYVLDVSIVRDPERDRYRITIESGNNRQIAIVDNATAMTYVDPGTPDARTIENFELIAGSGAATVNEYFDRLLLGPLRPDTFAAPTTRGRGLFDLDGDRRARQFVTNIRGELIPEWQLYAFSPVYEFPPEDRPSRLEYLVYVSEAGEITQVDGVSHVGEVAQLVQHRITVLDQPIAVELPPPGTVPVTRVPVPTSAPVTTVPVTTVPLTVPDGTVAATTRPTDP